MKRNPNDKRLPAISPGPWRVEVSKAGGHWIRTGPWPGLSICSLIGYGEMNADAALISAAPELLACVYSLIVNFPELGADGEINGADMVDWLNDQLPYWKDALKKAGVKLDAKP